MISHQKRKHGGIDGCGGAMLRVTNVRLGAQTCPNAPSLL